MDHLHERVEKVLKVLENMKKKKDEEDKSPLILLPHLNNNNNNNKIVKKVLFIKNPLCQKKIFYFNFHLIFHKMFIKFNEILVVIVAIGQLLQGIK